MTYSKRGTTEEDETSDSVQCEDNVEYVVWDGKYAYMPTAPGNLRNKVREQGIQKRGYYSKFATHDQRRNARNPARVPFLTSAIEKASCVDPGPGKAFPRVNWSLKDQGRDISVT